MIHARLSLSHASVSSRRTTLRTACAKRSKVAATSRGASTATIRSASSSSISSSDSGAPTAPSVRPRPRARPSTASCGGVRALGRPDTLEPHRRRQRRRESSRCIRGLTAGAAVRGRRDPQARRRSPRSAAGPRCERARSRAPAARRAPRSGQDRDRGARCESRSRSPLERVDRRATWPRRRSAPASSPARATRARPVRHPARAGAGPRRRRAPGRRRCRPAGRRATRSAARIPGASSSGACSSNVSSHPFARSSAARQQRVDRSIGDGSCTPPSWRAWLHVRSFIRWIGRCHGRPRGSIPRDNVCGWPSR